ncbi:hypothetical protein V5N11_020458 [Cardamine amara subsp. amara]|uniref:Uncharacterized protein n=1 Tax=Cardamine amara subsp. amara TaxID=228776 RepID=A0ABD1A6T3_CARAN
MPLSVSQHLDLYEFKPCNISLVLMDQYISHPVGLLENVPVKVGECLILTDFIVLDLEEELQDPIILGGPFLRTARAIINLQKGDTDLHLNDLVMKFDF